MARTKGKRGATRRKSTRKTSSSQRLVTYVVGGLTALLALVVLVGTAVWFGYEMGREESAKRCERSLKGYQKDLQRLRAKLAEHQKPRRNAPAEGERKTVTPTPSESSEIRDYLQSGGKEPHEAVASLPKKPEAEGRRPKLVIIIDDVATASQIRAIRALRWHVTPSLFPPSASHPDTPALAAKLSHYMIHLPMEAMRFNRPEEQTLTTESSEAEIDARMRRIRAWFPAARFVNNHTGSRFTSDRASMERFFPIARKYGFVFVDSRTTPKTVVPAICREYGVPYIARDIFLDNEADTRYIQNQLKKAVRIAKKRGYAIAIGHPHRTTLKALAASGKILSDVKVVYIDELFAKIR